MIRGTARPVARVARPTLVGLPLAATAAAALGAIHTAGARIRGRHRPDLDSLLEVPMHLERHRITTDDGAELRVVDTGMGRPLVLLHGMMLQWWTWAPQFNLMSGNWRVLAWDMRLHGESVGGTQPVSVPRLARDLALTLDELDLRDAIVVGHSLGGMTLMQLCIDHPELVRRRVAGCVYLGTSADPFGGGLLGGVARALAAAGTVAVNGPTRGLPRYRWGDNDLSAILVCRGFGRRPSSAAVHAVRAMVAHVPPATAVAFWDAVAHHRVQADLGALAAPGNYRSALPPAAVIVGSMDRMTPPAQARALVEALGGGRLDVIEGVGHQLMQEAPRHLQHLVEGFAADADRRRQLTWS